MTDKSEKIKYKKLARQKFSLVFPASLWLGPDHLLMVTSWSATEEYKRFFFEDIQAIVMTGTGGWKVCAGVTALIGTLFFLMALLTAEGWAAFAWIMGGSNLLIFVVNLLLGPSCDCHILTAVQKEKLFPVKRIKTFEKMAAIVRPLIEERQGRLETDMLENRMARRKDAGTQEMP